MQSEALCDVNEVLPAAALDNEAKYVNALIILRLFDSIHLF